MITDIRLQNFRSYSDETFEFTPGVNIILGPNASGKTNLIEAMLVACTGNSYRAKDSELIKFNQPWARIDCHEDSKPRSVKIEIGGNLAKKNFVVEHQDLKRLPNQKAVPVVLFEPRHLQVISGAPEIRRDFIDRLLEQTKPGYGPLLRQYKRALGQRNAFLKRDRHGGGTQLFVWNVRLSELAGQIVEQREGLVAILQNKTSKIYKELSGKRTKIELGLSSFTDDKTNYASKLLKKLEASTDLDFARGFTSYGPHREDLVITMNEHKSQETASRGEERTLLLALKIIEMELIGEARAKKPIILLDDVFSELDGARRRALTGFLKDYQTFITTTDADVVVQHFIESCNIIPLG